MWWPVYLALVALGGWGLHESIVRRSRAVFPALVAFACFGLLSMVPDVITRQSAVFNASANGSAAVEQVTHTATVGPPRYIWAGLGLLAGIWLGGVVIGIFPEEELTTHE